MHEKAEGDTERRESESKYKKWLLRDQEGGNDLKY